MQSLQIQISELTGAMNLCRKMKDDTITIESFDTTGYWNYIEEEEKQGYPFVDIAKDFVKEEKKFFFSYLEGFFCRFSVINHFVCFDFCVWRCISMQR